MLRTLTVFFLTTFTAIFFASPALAQGSISEQTINKLAKDLSELQRAVVEAQKKSGAVSAPENSGTICFPLDELSRSKITQLEQMNYQPTGEHGKIGRVTALVGIGVGLDDAFNVREVFPETPAARVNIPVGAKIISVDGVTTKTKDFDIIGAIRGNGTVGTTVHIALETKDAGVKTYTLSREKFTTEDEVPLLCFKKKGGDAK